MDLSAILEPNSSKVRSYIMELPNETFLISHWLTSLVGIVCLTFIYRRFTNNTSHIPGPEISKWTGVIYTYYWMSGKAPLYIHKLHEKYDQIDVCDINAVKEIHKTNSRFLKTVFYRNMVSGAVNNVFSTRDTKFHSVHRRLLASPISDSSLSRFEPLIADRINLTVSKITQELESRGVADVFKWWLFMATDIIGELSFGDSFRMLEAGKKNQYTIDMERLASYQPIRTTFPTLIKIASYIPLPMLRESVQAGKRIGMYAAQSIDRYRHLMAQNPSDPKPTLLTKLFDTEKNGLSFEDIRQEAQGYIVAGSDTTAVTMTYLSYAVSHDSRVREKLVAELTGLAEPITDKSLRNLPYLNLVITETLRLYTAVPLGLPRSVPPEGAHFCGFQIPGGITISTQSYSLHRDPSIFPDPNSFNPERWENPSKEMKDASLPFGGGARICLGIHLARMELRMATALFFRALPDARPSKKEGMLESDMIMESYFLMAPQGHRCLIET
ncbi:hypothetical protein N7499_002536 [Penicillium canescens]|nr:hypothetical protein N7499_002536 [Penicillium canescens]KAJ6166151.1 hypothetical protein N7485_009395 [Penicillium canescens]